MLPREDKARAVLISLGRRTTNVEHLLERPVSIEHIRYLQVCHLVHPHAAPEQHPDNCDIPATKVATGGSPKDVG